MNPLIRLIPSPLVRFFAKPYVAGDSVAKGVDAAARLLEKRGLLSTLDMLAEHIESEETARCNVETYLQLVDAVAEDDRFADGTRPSLSLKPSSYTTHPMDRGGDARGSREAVFRITEHATERGVDLTVDMEGRQWTDFTLQIVRDLHEAGHRHVGAVLQTRLNRTRDDLDRLPPGCRVRLVIGIYHEPESVAITDKKEMKQRMLDYGGELLRRGHYLEFATHDEPWVRRFVDEVAPAAGAGKDRYELQMLYGVPRDRLLAEMMEQGVRSRLYVPFALSWELAIEYLRRRLDEYPAMMFLVAKNLVLRK